MAGIDLLQSVQFVTVNGRRLAVVDAEDWDALIDWLETVEDAQLVRQSLASLAAAGGDRERAGWLPWDEVERQLR